jgi:hypothetical protein
MVLRVYLSRENHFPLLEVNQDNDARMWLLGSMWR